MKKMKNDRRNLRVSWMGSWLIGEREHRKRESSTYNVLLLIRSTPNG